MTEQELSSKPSGRHQECPECLEFIEPKDEVYLHDNLWVCKDCHKEHE